MALSERVGNMKEVCFRGKLIFPGLDIEQWVIFYNIWKNAKKKLKVAMIVLFLKIIQRMEFLSDHSFSPLREYFPSHSHVCSCVCRHVYTGSGSLYHITFCFVLFKVS